MRMHRCKDGQYRIDKAFSWIIYNSVVSEEKSNYFKGGTNKDESRGVC